MDPKDFYDHPSSQAAAAPEPVDPVAVEKARVLGKLYPTTAKEKPDAPAAGGDSELTSKIEAWEKELASDKEIGGQAFDESVAAARSLVAEFASDNLRALLNSTGLGSHPELVRIFAKVGRELAKARGRK